MLNAKLVDCRNGPKVAYLTIMTFPPIDHWFQSKRREEVGGGSSGGGVGGREVGEGGN